MEMSWILQSGCHLHVKSSFRLVLVLLIFITTFVLVMQTVYLHGKTYTFGVMLPPESYEREVESSFNRLFDNHQQSAKTFTKHKVKIFKPYQKFGREACIVRFDSKTHQNSSYELFNEKLNSTKPQKYILFKHPSKMSSSYDGNISVHVNNPGSFSIASHKNIYLMSAFARNLVPVPQGRTNSKHPDPGKEVKHVVMVGWIRYDYINETLRCCLLLANDTIVSYVNEKRLIWTQVNKQPLMAAKFFCSVPKDLYGVKVKGACMSLLGENCLNKKFLAIEFLKRRGKESLAVCAKIAYGQLSAQRLIEWLEVQKYIGVDKVLAYYYKLNEESMRVLLRYYKDGFVDLRPFDYPDAENNSRYVGQKDAQPFIDEQVVLYEAMERLRGYTYAAVIDVDEIIYARQSKKHNLKRFLGQLFRREPKAAGFSFRTELFITDWENKGDMGPEMRTFWHARYQNRTRPLEDRTKSIVVMDRIILGSVWTHNYTTLSGYKKFNVPASLGTLKHYRPCRKNWHCFLRRGYRDSNIAGLVSNIKSDIKNRFHMLLNNSTLSAIEKRSRNIL